jgi:hypothetical protein
VLSLLMAAMTMLVVLPTFLGSTFPVEAPSADPLDAG